MSPDMAASLGQSWIFCTCWKRRGKLMRRNQEIRRIFSRWRNFRNWLRTSNAQKPRLDPPEPMRSRRGAFPGWFQICDVMLDQIVVCAGKGVKGSRFKLAAKQAPAHPGLTRLGPLALESPTKPHAPPIAIGAKLNSQWHTIQRASGNFPGIRPVYWSAKIPAERAIGVTWAAGGGRWQSVFTAHKFCSSLSD